MDNNVNFVTVVFSNVEDPADIDELVNEVVTYPVVKRKEQNNGVVAYVVQGITSDIAMPLFREALDQRQLLDVGVVATVGNIFKV